MRLPRASTLDTLRAVVHVVTPMVAQGMYKRRPVMTALAETSDLDRRAVRVLQGFRTRYGPRPRAVS